MPVPIISTAQMREWEHATWASGQTEAEVIRRVGERIAGRARKFTRSDDLILILAGKGNNGNDARAVGGFLENRRVEILNIVSPENDLPKLEELLRKKPALIIDGLFGIGLNRPLDGGWQKLIATVNESKLPVLAADVPSGLDCETGKTFGAAIEAETTLTIGAPKIGMFTPGAWRSVGRLEVAEDVGLIPCALTSELNWVLPNDFENFPPRRAVAGHKGSFGHLAIVAGSFGFHGASVLAARAAQRAQPGLVTLFAQENIYQVVAMQLQAVMAGVWESDLRFPETTSAILIGPGLHAPGVAEKLKGSVRRWWRDFQHPMIVDASALDWLAPHSLSENLIRIVTPHPGEAARMLNLTTKEIQANRPQTVREISRRFGNCWVALKGHQTLIGRSGGEIFVNSSGNPHLAQGGSGDALSGFLAGLLAQPELQKDVCRTIQFAVWQHGAAADKLQSVKKNWVVEDLLAELGNAPISEK